MRQQKSKGIYSIVVVVWQIVGGSDDTLPLRLPSHLFYCAPSQPIIIQHKPKLNAIQNNTISHYPPQQ